MDQITTEQMDAAKEQMRGDWDLDGEASIYLPAETAIELANKMGITQDEKGRYCIGGATFWSLPEALQMALVAATK